MPFSTSSAFLGLLTPLPTPTTCRMLSKPGTSTRYGGGGWAFVGPTLIVSDPPTTHGIGYRGSNRKSRVTTDSLDRRNCFCRARPNLESFSPTRPRYWHSLLVLCPGLVRNTASLPDYGEAKLTRASTHAFESYSVFSRGSEMIACLSTGQSS